MQEQREAIVASSLEKWLEDGGAFPIIEINSYLHNDCFDSNTSAINHIIDKYFDVLADIDKMRLKNEFLSHFGDNL